jgi:hypothetical protein
MRDLTFALPAAGGLAFLSTVRAEAAGTRYPFCVQGREYPGLSSCTFASYAQCRATASGRLLHCAENPCYNRGGDVDPRGYRGPRAKSVYPLAR